MTKQNMYNFAQNETIMINNIAQNQSAMLFFIYGRRKRWQYLE